MRSAPLSADSVSSSGTTSTAQWSGKETTPTWSAKKSTSSTWLGSSVIEMQ